MRSCDYKTGMGGEFDAAGLSPACICTMIACHEAGHAVVSLCSRARLFRDSH